MIRPGRAKGPMVNGVAQFTKVSTFGELTNAITSANAGTIEGFIFLAKPITITANLDTGKATLIIPENCPLSYSSELISVKLRVIAGDYKILSCPLANLPYFYNPEIYVSWFGAKNDGTDAPGTRLAIQTAANISSRTYGPSVIFGAGTYKFDAQLTFTNANIKGQGKLKTFLMPTAALNGAVCVYASFSDYKSTYEAFTLDGSLTAGSIGLKVGYYNNFRNIKVQKFGGGGLGAYITDSVETQFVDCEFRESYVNAYIGSSVDVNTPTTLTFQDCMFNSATGIGVYINRGYQITFNNCTYQGNAQEAIKIQVTGSDNVGAGGVIINGGWFEANQLSNPDRVNSYAFIVDGSTLTTGTIMIQLSKAHFNISNISEKGFDFNNVKHCILDSPQLGGPGITAAGKIRGASKGEIVSWNQNNYPMSSGVLSISADSEISFVDAIKEIRVITGTIPAGATELTIAYPANFTRDNTSILALKMGYNGTGYAYIQNPIPTNTLGGYRLFEANIKVDFTADVAYDNQPYSIVLMR